MLRNCKHTKTSIFVFAIELNLNKVIAREIANVCEKFVPCTFLWEGKEDTDPPGVYTNGANEDKYRFQRNMNMFLFNDQVAFHYPFISSTNGIPQEIINQARNFRRVSKPVLNADFDNPKYTYSGKSAGKDDMLITMQMFLFWGSIFYSDERYCGRGEKRGLRGIPTNTLSERTFSQRRLQVKPYVPIPGLQD